MASQTLPADLDIQGRATFSSLRPICVAGGFRLGTVTETRTEDGWESEYDFDWSFPVFATEAEAAEALRQATVVKASLYLSVAA